MADKQRLQVMVTIRVIRKEKRRTYTKAVKLIGPHDAITEQAQMCQVFKDRLSQAIAEVIRQEQE